MIDRRFLQYPDFHKMLSTYSQLCIGPFSYLYKSYLKKGHVDEYEYGKLGFTLDEDTDGSFVRRIAGIN